MEQNRFIQAAGDYYFTDALAERAAAMIRESAADGKPFYLHWTPTAPHWPLHARPADIERCRGRYRDGWDALREARYARLLAEGLLKPEWDISPRDEHSRPWTEVADPAWEALRMAVYAAQIKAVDRGVGQVLRTLEDIGAADNTLFLFLSDNGACAEFLREDSELHQWPGHYRLPTLDDTMAHVGNAPDRDPGPADTFMIYDLPWANASNTPFRRFKSWTHDGGIATPLIAHWPAGMAGDRTERHNLAGQAGHAATTARLAALWDAWAARIGV